MSELSATPRLARGLSSTFVMFMWETQMGYDSLSHHSVFYPFESTLCDQQLQAYLLMLLQTEFSVCEHSFMHQRASADTDTGALLTAVYFLVFI